MLVDWIGLKQRKKPKKFGKSFTKKDSKWTKEHRTHMIEKWPSSSDDIVNYKFEKTEEIE